VRFAGSRIPREGRSRYRNGRAGTRSHLYPADVRSFVRSEERLGGALLPSLVEDVIGSVSPASEHEHVHQHIVMMKWG
jgi:hypothetical protein